MVDSSNRAHIALVMSKTKVAPIKRQTIPRLELCGAHLLAELLHHAHKVLHVPMSNVFAWSDSTIVLRWLNGSHRQFKTFVGNRVSHIVEFVPPDKWNHINGAENPADCASRGLLPSELIEHELWWRGPSWLRSDHQSGLSKHSLSGLGTIRRKRGLPLHSHTAKDANHPAGPILNSTQVEAHHRLGTAIHQQLLKEVKSNHFLLDCSRAKQCRRLLDLVIAICSLCLRNRSPQERLPTTNQQ